VRRARKRAREGPRVRILLPPAASPGLILLSGLGSVVGPLIGASLMAHFTIDGVFYFMAAAALILTFLAAGRSFTTMAPHHLERPFEILAPQAVLGPVGGALVQRFGPRQAHVAFRCIRRRAGSELLNGGAVLMLAASAIAIGLLRSALNFDPAKTQVRR